MHLINIGGTAFQRTLFLFDGIKVLRCCAVYLHLLKKSINIPISIRFSVEDFPNLIIRISCLIVGVCSSEFVIAQIVVVTHNFILLLCLTVAKVLRCCAIYLHRLMAFCRSKNNPDICITYFSIECLEIWFEMILIRMLMFVSKYPFYMFTRYKLLRSY